MAETRIISVVSQKGGVGKSTVSMLMADVLHHQGKVVTVVDTDPQRTAQKWESKRLEGYAPYPVRVEAVSGLREDEFAQWLQKRAEGVDFFVIDTPPNLASKELRAALYLADRIILPFIPHSSSIDALEEVVPLLDEVAQSRGEALDIRILLNRVDKRRASEAAIVDNLSKLCTFPILKTRLKNLASYADANNYRTSFYALSATRDARETLEAMVKEATK